MSGMVGYQYVTLRLVPCIVREEFMNVGVVVYSQMADYLDADFHLSEARLKAFAPAIDPAEVDDALAGLCRAVRGEESPGRPRLASLGQRFGWISAPRSTIIQPGPLHGGTTDSPKDSLSHLMNRLVG